MTEYSAQIPTADLVLESAADLEKIANYDPSGSDVLISELNLPTDSDRFLAFVKSTEITQPDVLEKSAESSTNSNAVLDGKLIESIVSPITNFIKNVKSLTNNYLGQNANVLLNSEKISKDSITELIKETESSYSSIVENNLRETSNILQNTESISSEVNSSVLNNRDLIQKNLEKMSETINSATIANSSILDKVTSASEKSSNESSSFLSSTESSILKMFQTGSDSSPATEGSQNTQNTSSVNNVSLKNNKLVERSDVKNILTPDRTLEKSVSVLSKTLPEAVNNLSTSVTSISPTSTSNNSSFVEGAKIDQSTSTTINQMPGYQNTNNPSDNTVKPETQNSQTNEYYLQAIYAALMSGKIKVKLETY